jgi:hypothetical protein
MIYDLERPWTDIGFTQVFAAPGAFARPEALKDWLLFRAGEACVAIWCSCPLLGVAGLYKHALLRAQGLRTAWVVAMPLPRESAAAFEGRLLGAVPQFDADHLTLETRTHDGQSLTLAFADGLMIAGKTQVFGPLTTHPHIVET